MTAFSQSSEADRCDARERRTIGGGLCWCNLFYDRWLRNLGRVPPGLQKLRFTPLTLLAIPYILALTIYYAMGGALVSPIRLFFEN